jgi:hypothetical protein
MLIMWLKLIQSTHTVHITVQKLELELLGLLPSELLVGEVAVLGRLVVDGVGKVELLDDDTGTEVEVLEDNLNKLLRGFLRGTVVLDEERQGLGNTNSVRQLDKAAAGQFGGNERLSDPARKISSRAVDLGIVLAGEGTTTVSTPAAVGVDDDLTAGETGITLGTTNDEQTGGLDL